MSNKYCFIQHETIIYTYIYLRVLYVLYLYEASTKEGEEGIMSIQRQAMGDRSVQRTDKEPSMNSKCPSVGCLSNVIRYIKV